jgi:hypothetical protein
MKKLRTDNRGMALLLTVIILSAMLVIALGASDILNKGLRAANLSGRSTVAYLAAESGAERILWYAVNDAAFETNFSACSGGGYIDMHIPGGFTCASYNHLIDGSNTNYYYRAYYKKSGIYHVFQSIGYYYSARRNIEIKYVK